MSSVWHGCEKIEPDTKEAENTASKKRIKKEFGVSLNNTKTRV